MNTPEFFEVIMANVPPSIPSKAPIRKPPQPMKLAIEKTSNVMPQTKCFVGRALSIMAPKTMIASHTTVAVENTTCHV